MSQDEADTSPRAFGYSQPELECEKHVVLLAQTDRMIATVQVLQEGGENNLHAHPNSDGFWMVMGGRVKFYGDDDVLLGEFGPTEGILIPRGSRYWFEKSSDEPLQILQIEAFNVPMRNLKSIMADRTNFTPMKQATLRHKVHEGRAAN